MYHEIYCVCSSCKQTPEPMSSWRTDQETRLRALTLVAHKPYALHHFFVVVFEIAIISANRQCLCNDRIEGFAPSLMRNIDRVLSETIHPLQRQLAGTHHGSMVRCFALGRISTACLRSVSNISQSHGYIGYLRCAPVY